MRKIQMCRNQGNLVPVLYAMAWHLVGSWLAGSIETKSNFSLCFRKSQITRARTQKVRNPIKTKLTFEFGTLNKNEARSKRKTEGVEENEQKKIIWK